MNTFKQNKSKLIKRIFFWAFVALIFLVIFFPITSVFIEHVRYGISEDHTTEEDTKILREYILTRPYKDYITNQIESIEVYDYRLECYTPLSNMCRNVFLDIPAKDYEKVSAMIDAEREKRIKKHFITKSSWDRFHGRSLYESMSDENDEDKDGFVEVVIYIN